MQEPEAHAALELLCRRYWYPIYVYVRRLGYPHHTAEDCTQGFLAHLLARDAFVRASPERGRFRTFLLSALGNYLINDWHRSHAQKRGAGAAHLSLEFAAAAQRYDLDPPSPTLTPEQSFDRNWSLAIIDQALAELRGEYDRAGRGGLFRELEPLLWQDATTDTHATCAARLGLQTHTFTVALERLRHRLSERLRHLVSETVVDESGIDEELRHLLASVT